MIYSNFTYKNKKWKQPKRKTLPFIFLHSFFSAIEQDMALIISFQVCSWTCLSAIATWVHYNHQCCSFSYNGFLFLKEHDSHGVTSFSLLCKYKIPFTYNLEKHLVSQGAHLQYLIHLSPSRHFSFLFIYPSIQVQNSHLSPFQFKDVRANCLCATLLRR